MKKITTLLALFIVTICFGQIPAGYYNSATGSGYALKTQLKTRITTGHNDQGYAELWNLYTQTAFRDNYYENNGSLLDMYSENPTGNDAYEYTTTNSQCGSYSGEGDCYNREHLVPQSYFDNFQVNPMKNDPFHVVPSDGKVNGDRGNLPFGVVSAFTYESTNGSKRGPNTVNAYSSYSGTVFEPINAFKGDIARAFFYFATRYEDSMDDFYSAANGATCQAKNMFNGTTTQVFSDNFILLLIKWHNEDPVSPKEIAQNNAIYLYQGNRNPFIDNPNYVCQIWAAQCATVNALSNESFASLDNVSVYPNPSNENKINIQSSVEIKDIQLFSINGQLIKEVKNPEFNDNFYTLDNLPKGFYFLRLSSENQSTTKKVIIN
ncbi:endonuclease [Flavobacterium sp.]|uniref:endonuclease n=1 Tax=Flavobacterium sp. TaxID=239 RepID=UPI000EBBFCEE|nr:endonuclease [Flavobacterium sp.]HCQ12954.1 ribonuclease [Flavobacterium sp.]